MREIITKCRLHNLPKITCWFMGKTETTFGDHSRYLKPSSVDSNTITKTGNSSWKTSAYSKQWIPSHINALIQWKITIHETYSSPSLIIGLINKQHHHKTDNDIDSKGCYSWCNNGVLSKDGNSGDTQRCILEDGQEALLTLDLRSKEIRMRVLDDTDSNKDEVLFEYIQYKLAMGLYARNDSVTVSVETYQIKEKEKVNDVKRIASYLCIAFCLS